MVEGKNQISYAPKRTPYIRKITQEKHELQSTLSNSGCLKVMLRNDTCMWSKNFLLVHAYKALQNQTLN